MNEDKTHRRNMEIEEVIHSTFYNEITPQQAIDSIINIIKRHK